MMQTDVLSAHLNATGFFLLNGTATRTRFKQFTYAPNGSQAGTLIFFDSLQTPTSAVYARSGNTVTVTKTGHGLSTGTAIGIGFMSSSNVAATDGNYTITVVDANTFTVTDPSSGTVSGGTACYYVVAYANGNNTPPQKWVSSVDTFAGQTSTQQVLIPGEGVLIANGLYAQMTNIPFCTIFYG
jgi:hypothetical protein